MGVYAHRHVAYVLQMAFQESVDSAHSPFGFNQDVQNFQHEHGRSERIIVLQQIRQDINVCVIAEKDGKRCRCIENKGQ